MASLPEFLYLSHWWLPFIWCKKPCFNWANLSFKEPCRTLRETCRKLPNSDAALRGRRSGDQASVVEGSGTFPMSQKEMVWKPRQAGFGYPAPFPCPPKMKMEPCSPKWEWPAFESSFFWMYCPYTLAAMPPRSIRGMQNNERCLCELRLILSDSLRRNMPTRTCLQWILLNSLSELPTRSLSPTPCLCGKQASQRLRENRLQCKNSAQVDFPFLSPFPKGSCRLPWRLGDRGTATLHWRCGFICAGAGLAPEKGRASDLAVGDVDLHCASQCENPCASKL